MLLLKVFSYSDQMFSWLNALFHVCCVLCSQEANSKTHKASKVLILGNLKLLLTTGTSRWNDRQMVLWDPVRVTTEQLTAQQVFLDQII